jgi:uncharacterized protein (UPF0303 family)
VACKIRDEPYLKISESISFHTFKLIFLGKRTIFKEGAVVYPRKEVYLMDEYKELLEQLLQQEKDLQFSEFTNTTAYQVGKAIIEKALKEEKFVVVDIRRNGELLFHTKLDGTGPNNDQWIKRKINVAHHFGHSSYYMHVLYKSLNTTIQENAYVDPMDYAAEGGSFPIVIRNVGPIGTISVSGLPGEDDHGLIVSTLKDFLKL